MSFGTSIFLRATWPTVLGPAAGVTDLAAWSPPTSLQWMPPGAHEIEALRGLEPWSGTVSCDADCAARLDAQLQQQLALAAQGKASRPYIDFDHESGAAAAIPVRFYWQDGVRLDVQWTDAGASALRGRAYSYFSPEFLLGEDGQPVALPDRGPIGALVNTPAFQSIERLAAAHESFANSMKKLLAALAAAKLIPSADATDDQASSLFEASWAQHVEASKNRTTELDQLKATVSAQRKSAAEAEIAAAVTAGRIKDEPSLRAKWVESLMRDEAGTRDMIKSLPETRPAGGAAPVQGAAAGANQSVPVADALKALDSLQGAELIKAFHALPEGPDKDKYLRTQGNRLLKAQRVTTA